MDQWIYIHMDGRLNIIPNVPLPDQHPSMVDWLRHTRLEDKGLKTPLQEVLHCQGQHIIQLVLTLIQKTIPVHPSQKGFTLKDTARVLLIQSEKVPCSITDTAKNILNPPQLSLVPKPIFSHKLQLSIQTLFLIRATGLLKSLPIYISQLYMFTQQRNWALNSHSKHNMKFWGGGLRTLQGQNFKLQRTTRSSQYWLFQKTTKNPSFFTLKLNKCYVFQDAMQFNQHWIYINFLILTPLHYIISSSTHHKIGANLHFLTTVNPQLKQIGNNFLSNRKPT